MQLSAKFPAVPKNKFPIPLDEIQALVGALGQEHFYLAGILVK
jgi:hypothetical protein